MPLLIPTSLAAFIHAFGDEAACRVALERLRWPDGFRCPACGGDSAWERPGREIWVCRTCRHDTYLTAGSALHQSKVPLPIWFLAAHLVATTPGLNSITFARQAALSRQGTAWLLLAKMRRAMAGALDAPLLDTVEADETWFGGPQAGVRGQQRAGRKALLVLVLAEARSEGRARMLRLPDNGKVTLTARIAKRVEAGATIRTDGWKGYNGLVPAGFIHDRRPHPPGGMKIGSPHATPYADQAISAAKRWILATYNKPPREHLDAYLAEWCFRREFRDPATATEMLLRHLITVEPSTRTSMASGADLHAVPHTPSHTPSRAKKKVPILDNNRNPAIVVP